jgi:hypothetical protein
MLFNEISIIITKYQENPYIIFRKEWLKSKSEKFLDLELSSILVYNKNNGICYKVDKSENDFYNINQDENGNIIYSNNVYEIKDSDIEANDWMYECPSNRNLPTNLNGEIIHNDCHLKIRKYIPYFSMEHLNNDKCLSRGKWNNENKIKSFIHMGYQIIWRYLVDDNKIIYSEHWKPVHDDLIAKDWYICPGSVLPNNIKVDI